MHLHPLRLACLLALLACASHRPAIVVETIAPRAQDVESIDGIMRAFYEVVNVAADEPRQWSRDRTLYSPWIRFVAIGRELKVFDHQAFVEDTEPMIRAGFHERELHRIVHQYGNIAQVESSYETRSGPDGALSRGVNFLQLYFDGKRWWVANGLWQTEDAEHPIPPALLGGVQSISIHTPRGEFRVWTQRRGDNPRVKVLLLHGGPGATHEYFEVLERSLPAAGIEFIYYDQLGSLFSDQPTDDTLWTVERFVDEVEQVRLALGLDRDNFYLLGHSWGGILAMEYALAHGEHLKGLVISNMMMSIPAYNRYTEEVLSRELSPAIVAALRGFEARNATDDPQYEALLQEHYYSKHLCRLNPWPDAWSRGFSHLNRHVYELMQGPSEFGASGRLAGWDRTADLGKVSVPALFIGATYDTMDPAQLKRASEQVQNGSFLLCPRGSHGALFDDAETWATGLLTWLKAVDAGQSKVTLAAR